MHVATGALAGAVTGDRAAAAVAGLALHAAGDAIPHEDFESLQLETGLGLALIAALAIRRGFTDPAVIGAVFSAAPDLEHVLPRPGHDRPSSSPPTGSTAGTGAAGSRRRCNSRRRSLSSALWSCGRRRDDVPWIDVKLYDHRVNDESVPKIIESLTKALAESSGASPEHIEVVVQGVSPKHWGVAGKPGA